MEARLARVGAEIAVAQVGDYRPGLFSEEASYAESVVHARALEFSTGREVARTALGRIGLADCEIPRRGRLPVWSPSAIGSIAHARTLGGSFATTFQVVYDSAGTKHPGAAMAMASLEYAGVDMKARAYAIANPDNMDTGNVRIKCEAGGMLTCTTFIECDPQEGGDALFGEVTAVGGVKTAVGGVGGKVDTAITAACENVQSPGTESPSAGSKRELSPELIGIFAVGPALAGLNWQTLRSGRWMRG